jgi:hypothetical protein
MVSGASEIWGTTQAHYEMHSMCSHVSCFFLIQGFILMLHHSRFRCKKDKTMQFPYKQERNIILFITRMDSLRTDFIFVARIYVAYKNWSSQAPIWKTIKQEGLQVTFRNRGVTWMDPIIQVYLYCSNVSLSWGTLQFKKCNGGPCH